MTVLVALAGTLAAPVIPEVRAHVQDSGAPVVVKEGFGAGAYRPGNGVITPSLIVQKVPQYTTEGLKARIEGSVEIELVVNADGSVGDARVTKSLDAKLGLDAQAIDAVRQWKYLPALLNGKPVPCVMTTTVPFKLTTPTSTVKGDPPSQETAEEFRKGAYLEDTPDLVKPTLITQATSEYTNEARQRKISGDVELEAIVMPDGSIGKVRITKSLDRTYGLDQQAVNSVRKWKFRPGLLNGLPVPVVVAVTIAFRLH